MFHADGSPSCDTSCTSASDEPSEPSEAGCDEIPDVKVNVSSNSGDEPDVEPGSNGCDESNSDNDVAVILPLKAYLNEQVYPSDSSKGDKSVIRRRAKQFQVTNDTLYYVQPSKVTDKPILC